MLSLGPMPDAVRAVVQRLVANPVAGIGLELIFSDLMRHFVVLPLWIGETGWHWP